MDQRVDLYSLAAVAYFALLGEPPFPGRHPGAGPGQADHQPVPPAARQATEVPEALEHALQRALRTEVELRYPSATEFLQALNRAGGKVRRAERRVGPLGDPLVAALATLREVTS